MRLPRAFLFRAVCHPTLPVITKLHQELEPSKRQMGEETTYGLGRATFCSDVGFDGWIRPELRHGLLSSGMVNNEAVELGTICRGKRCGECSF